MQKEKTAVCGLCEELSEEFSESSIRITGILREWDVIHTKERSKKYLNKEVKIMIRIKQ